MIPAFKRKTFSMTSMHIAGVVADANVLLSAAIGKAALRVLTDFDVEVHTTYFNYEEVEEYLPLLATKYRLSYEVVDMQWRLLPLRIHEEADYATRFDHARSLLAKRDPDDAHPLALAMALDLPLWSNDKDLCGHGTTSHTTAQLLALLSKKG
jgi:predicted nucleic acid-binding protein